MIGGSSAAREAAAASHDGLTGQIAFVRGSPTGEAVYVVAARGGGLRRLTIGGRSSDDQPAWSPSGRHVVVARSVDGGRSYRLYVLGASGRGVRALTPKRGRLAQSPSWSPDGRWIAFTGSGGVFGECKGDVFVIRPDGTGLRRLVRAGSSVSWSPDGRRLAFVREDARGRSWIYVVLSSGKGQRRLVAGGHPDWSPDGRRLAFVREASGVTRVFLVGANGRGVRPLTHGRTFQLDPDWSPDGRWIAYYSTAGRMQSIYAAPVAGGAPRRLTSAGLRAGDHDPAWRP